MLTYLVLSDIHLGHHINKTENIINNLEYFFFNYSKELENNLDIIFLAGDVFDRLLSTSSPDYILINQWLTDLVLYCKKHNIILRILEGTASHDWKQSKLVINILNRLNLEIDIKYIDNVYIEYIPKHDLNILYVPDDWNSDSSITYKEVLKLLNKNKLKQVDIAIMHGAFNYQLPILLNSNFKEEDYLNIVKYYISIGHVHTFSMKDRIIAQGSFDRLKHGEEEDKGGVLINIDKNTNASSFKFLVNTRSMKFITVDYINKDIKTIIKELNKLIQKLPEDSNIRVIVDDSNISNLKNNYNRKYNVKFIKADTSNKNKDITSNSILSFKEDQDNFSIESFTINKNNIEELLDKRIAKYNLSQKEYIIYKEELQKILTQEYL